MPQVSKKKLIIDSLVDNALKRVKLLEDQDEENIEGISAVFDEVYEDLTMVMLNRRGVEPVVSRVPKQLVNRCEKMLSELSNDEFYDLLRVNRSQFNLLHQLIRDDIEFIKMHSCKQYTTETQLAVTLCRLGAVGEKASIRSVASQFNVSDGGCYKVTERVLAAFLRILPKYLKWPTSKERAEIVRATYHELPHCVGYVNTMEVILSDPPAAEIQSYFSEKHNYAVKAQLVVDHRHRIRDVVVGFPGSQENASIFRNCSLVSSRAELFDDMQWLAGDVAMPLLDPLITPFVMNAKHTDVTDRFEFNDRLLRYHARSEACVLLLKERWRSLQNMRLRLVKEKGQRLLCDWVLVCCMLHNLLLRSNSIKMEVKPEEKEYISVEKNVQTEIKRERIFRLMFPSSRGVKRKTK